MSVPRHPGLLLLVAALACAHPHAAPTPPAREPVAPDSRVRPGAPVRGREDLLIGEVAAEHAFAWSDRRLVWGDFQGPPPPPGEGREGAKTAYTLFYAWKCRGDAFQFQTIAAFRPRASWVKPAIVRDSAESRRALQHEQTHFDLSEVGARRLRRYFAQLPTPCHRSDDELGALARRLVDEEKAEQRRYDDETEHGLDARRQAVWTADTAQRLAALNQFGS